jgi:hypothetical protein
MYSAAAAASEPRGVRGSGVKNGTGPLGNENAAVARISEGGRRRCNWKKIPASRLSNGDGRTRSGGRKTPVEPSVRRATMRKAERPKLEYRRRDCAVHTQKAHKHARTDDEVRFAT